MIQFAAGRGYIDRDNYGGIIGLARDGHLVYGPYNSEGKFWNCHDHDVCNGFFTDDGQYAYATT